MEYGYINSSPSHVETLCMIVLLETSIIFLWDPFVYFTRNKMWIYLNFPVMKFLHIEYKQSH